MHYPTHSKYRSSTLAFRRIARTLPPRANAASLPVAAFRERAVRGDIRQAGLSVSEKWHEPRGHGPTRFIVHPPGCGFLHPVSAEEVRERLSHLPQQFTRELEVVQFSTLTRKRQTFPCYGMQWGPAVYLYPIEQGLVEDYPGPPTPQHEIEARMFGGRWLQDGEHWKLVWTPDAIRDFYLNNVLIHEIGHLNDPRNSRARDRERFANWFAIEYGYRRKR